tara:strand:+ start:1112 stop:2551 length:1440 start_codon:yes stop_codon:yes gene_type:complete
MSTKQIIPVILCGGLGTRLWPLSRESYPKQYLSINSKENKSLLQKTQERLKGIKNIQPPIIICNEEHRFIVAEQMREINIEPNIIILEPEGRNTAPAINIAALKALQSEEDPIILVLSSDHYIEKNSEFRKVVEIGINYAVEENLVTFGVVPSSPQIGYGYIKSDKPYDSENLSGERILKFIEKPNLDLAKKFTNDKHFTWNSGIFMFKAKIIVQEINKYNPLINNCCKKALLNGMKDLDFLRLEKESFCENPNVSIDICVMEKTKNGIVIPLNAGWNDLGSWKSVWESYKKDNSGNFITGKSIIKNSKDCLVYGENRLIVGMGLENMIIVDTNDAILIMDKKFSQDVKNIVQELKNMRIPEGKNHSKKFRPWGDYTSISNGPNWQVKLINVKPGEQLSLQMHNLRSEHWIVVKGIAKVEIDEKICSLYENESIFIAPKSHHRLSNPTNNDLILIEVQSGTYFGEDDIIRFDDKYGRIS